MSTKFHKYIVRILMELEHSKSRSMAGIEVRCTSAFPSLPENIYHGTSKSSQRMLAVCKLILRGYNLRCKTAHRKQRKCSKIHLKFLYILCMKACNFCSWSTEWENERKPAKLVTWFGGRSSYAGRRDLRPSAPINGSICYKFNLFRT